MLTVSRNSMGIDNMKSANYREISKEFPNAWCSSFSPPASDKLGLLSACTGVVKRHGLSICVWKSFQIIDRRSGENPLR